MKRLLAAALLAATLPAFSQQGGWSDISSSWREIQTPPGTYATLAPPAGCASGYVPYFDASLKLVCSPTVYAPATDTTTATGTIAARNLTATALTTPVITPPVSNVLSLFTTVTVVAGASLVDGDYFTLSDGSAVVYEFDSAPAGVTAGRVAITFTGAESAQAIRDLVVVAINGSTLEATAIAAAADTLTVTSDTAGDTMGVNSENVANAGFLVPAWGEPTHATTYGYKVEACLADGSCAPSAEVQTATGHATLSNANYNSVTWGAVTGASYYKLTRVTGTPAGGDAPPRLLYTGPLLTFQDTNAASTSEAVATGNETGVITAAKFVGPGLGITNSAGANVLPKSDGTNLVASALSESGDTFSLGAQAGTNVAGKSKTFVGNLGTGNATSGNLVFRTGVPQASGATQHVAATALTLTNAGTGGTSRPQVIAADGAYQAPSFSFASSPTIGLYRGGASDLGLVGTTVWHVLTSGTIASVFDANGHSVTSTGGYRWSSTAEASGAGDLFLTRAAAATLQLGAAASATPVAQTLQAQGARGGTDMNVGGANLVLSSGIGTGNGTVSKLILRGPYNVGSGTTAQSTTDWLTVSEANGIQAATHVRPDTADTRTIGLSTAAWQAAYLSRAILGSKSKTLTDATPTGFATIPMADGVATGGKLIYRCVVTSGTSRQVVSGSINYAAVRDGASYVVDYDEVQQSTAVTTGTLTGEVTASGASSLLTFSANFDTSLGTPTITFYYRFDSTDTLAITPL